MGRDHFRDALGDGNAAEFARVARWASWATHTAGGDHAAPAVPLTGDGDEIFRTMGWVQKRAIGRRCKALIDAGRADFLRRRGFVSVARGTYCDEAVSPENWVLVGVRG